MDGQSLLYWGSITYTQVHNRFLGGIQYLACLCLVGCSLKMVMAKYGLLQTLPCF
jgi:hypothetical protein